MSDDRGGDGAVRGAGERGDGTTDDAAADLRATCAAAMMEALLTECETLRVRLARAERERDEARELLAGAQRANTVLRQRADEAEVERDDARACASLSESNAASARKAGRELLADRDALRQRAAGLEAAVRVALAQHDDECCTEGPCPGDAPCWARDLSAALADPSAALPGRDRQRADALADAAHAAAMHDAEVRAKTLREAADVCRTIARLRALAEGKP